ncbi:MAG: TolC family protein [Phycisphaerales bacterium]|nr:TolC family protein [Phycisphaerales bacterium]
MPDHPFPRPGGRARILAALSAGLLLASGCHTTRPDPAPEGSISRATGLEGAVEFRTEGGPIDEPEAAGASLTAHDAVRRAVTTDPGLQAALARVRIAMADADQARLLPNPVLDVVLRWGPGRPQFEVSLAQELVRALQSPRRVRAADHRLRQAAADAVTVALDVTAGVRERYARAQALDALVPVLEDRRAILDQLVSVARSRLEAGEGTRSDVTTLDAQRVELEVEVAQARLAQRQERLRLSRLIGEPSGAGAWTLDPWSAPEAGNLSEARWIEAALRSRPEVQSIAWRLAALGDDPALAGLAAWEGGGAGAEVTRDDRTFAGPSISTPLPIFDTGRARRARITAERIEARHDLSLARRRVVEEVRVGYQAMAASRAIAVRIRRELIPLQQERRRAAEGVFRAENDVTPLLLAEQDLRAAQARAIEVEQDAALSLLRLERAVGGPGVAAALTGSETAPPAPGGPSPVTGGNQP